MIYRRDILDRAGEWGLRPEVVEKDYVLGWFLAGIASHPQAGTEWVFKGGTSLRKCFVETFRFSEDLDFTLLPGSAYQEPELTRLLVEVATWVTDASGIAFQIDDLILKSRQNQQGEPTWEARLGYRGPLEGPATPKVRFDFTIHEPVVLPPMRSEIQHPYPDDLPGASRPQCYAFEEVLAEKLRALVERTRPRDLYDVVLVIENYSAKFDLSVVADVFRKKCVAKKLSAPSAREIVILVGGSAELAAEWSNMLAHQLPALPPLKDLLQRLPAVLNFLAPPTPTPVAYRTQLQPAALGGGIPDPAVIHRSSHYWGLGTPLDLLRFAGASRLLVEFNYHGKHRLVEPYALRRPKTGNLLLYAWELASTQIKAFKVQEMQGLRVSDRAFRPKYLVEF